ncbi:MAG: hypothetical protein U0570_10430 [Phycisphaerales bacterium]
MSDQAVARLLRCSLNRMDQISLNSSLKLHQAYNTPLPRSAAGVATGGTPVAGTLSRAALVADQVAIARPEKLARTVERLSAGSVQQPAIDKTVQERSVLTPPATYTSRGTLAMHSQPGDRNAAATGVAIGRLVDLNG